MFQMNNHPINLIKPIETEVRKVLKENLPNFLLCKLEEKSPQLVKHISKQAHNDLLAFAAKDPASKKSPKYILDSYLSFHAVLKYRVANALVSNLKKFDESYSNCLETIARKISEKAKAETGIEIHPAAQIGERFIIDHGFGTVIGETSVIGNDCYLLQGVILGAKHIAKNQSSKRHPTLKNGVEVGGFVSVIGAITIGNNVRISPNCIITEDIPDNAKVIFEVKQQIICNPVVLYK